MLVAGKEVLDVQGPCGQDLEVREVRGYALRLAGPSGWRSSQFEAFHRALVSELLTILLTSHWPGLGCAFPAHVILPKVPDFAEQERAALCQLPNMTRLSLLSLTCGEKGGAFCKACCAAC